MTARKNGPAKPLKTHIPQSVLRIMLKDKGGKFSGPNVEHLVMEEHAFWRFMEEVIDVAWKRQIPETL